MAEYLDRCIGVERAAATIYKKLAGHHLEHADFFSALVHEEESHIYILSIAMSLDRVGKLSSVDVSAAEEALAGVESLSERLIGLIDSGEYELSEALGMAVMLEDSVIETYVEDFLTKDDIPNLKALLADTSSHRDRLKRLLASVSA